MDRKVILCLAAGVVFFLLSPATGAAAVAFGGTMGMVLDWEETAETAGLIKLDSEINLWAKAAGEGKAGGFFSLRHRLSEPDRIEAQEAYLEFAPNTRALVRIGRQKVAWGTGFGWNPTNYITAETEEKGVDVAMFRLSRGGYRGTLLVKPGESLDETETAFRFSRFLYNKDFSASLYRGERKNGAGVDFVCVCGDYVFYGEAAAKSGLPLLIPVTPEEIPDGSYWQGVAGCYRLFPGEFFLVLEYFSEHSRDYLSIAASKSFRAGELTLSHNLLWSLRDNSYRLNPDCRYLLGPDSYFEFSAEFYQGETGTVFGAPFLCNYVAMKLTWYF